MPKINEINALSKNQSKYNALYDLLELPLSMVEKQIQIAFDHEQLPMLKAISEHIIGAGGKRIRPVLCLAIASIISSAQNPSLIKTATALEFIHTATLLHDDVIDKGSVRRGNKTAHRIWGNQAAILAGDHMFASAFTLLAETNNLKAITVLSNAAKMLAQGEIIQLSFKQKIPSQEAYFNILKHKTASLFAAGCACGAVFNDASEITEQNAYNFGYNFGISFQLVDDILDYEGSENGNKLVGSDFFEGKFTLPLILAYNEASPDNKIFIETVMLKQKERTQSDFEAVKSIINNLNTISKARIVAKGFIHDAETSLNALKGNRKISHALVAFLDKTLYRKL